MSSVTVYFESTRIWNFFRVFFSLISINYRFHSIMVNYFKLNLENKKTLTGEYLEKIILLHDILYVNISDRTLS